MPALPRRPARSAAHDSASNKARPRLRARSAWRTWRRVSTRRTSTRRKLRRPAISIVGSPRTQGNQTAQQAKINSDIQAASGLNQTAQNAGQLANNAYTMQNQAGTEQMAQAQNQINAQMQKFQQAWGYPTQQLGVLQSALGMTPYGQTTTGQSNTQTQTPTDWAQLAGAGIGALGCIFAGKSDKRLKKNLQKLGTHKATGTPIYAFNWKGEPPGAPKSLGPMAQDLAKTMPGSVAKHPRTGVLHRSSGGARRVGYARAGGHDRRDGDGRHDADVEDSASSARAAASDSWGARVAREERPQYQFGTGTIGDQSFHWGSGQPGKYWSIPYGDYPVTPDAPTGDWAHRVGAIPIANNVIPDPQLGRNRIGIMIHSGSASSLDALYTQGCFKVAPSEWPAVREEILKEAKSGPLYLHVQPGGVASFTNTKTLDQASIPTAGAPGPPARAPGTTINASTTPIAGGLAKPSSGGGGFLTSVANIESNDRNIPSAVDKDYPGQPGSKSQGHWQIDTPTWLQFGAAAGIDTTKYPNAMSAPRDIQEQVARTIPLSRFGGRTVKMLTQQYGALDKSLTLGTLDAKYGGGAPGAAAASSSTGDTPPSTATASAPSADQGTWWQQAYGKIVDKPVDAQGNPTGKSSPMENIVSAFEKGPARMKALEEDQAPESVKNYTGTAPPARNVSPGLANVSQTYGQTLNSFSQPLTWNDAPPQAPQMPAGGFRPAPAGQGPGISLNSVQPSPYGVGYGINPVGYGYG